MSLNDFITVAFNRVIKERQSGNYETARLLATAVDLVASYRDLIQDMQNSIENTLDGMELR